MTGFVLTNQALSDLKAIGIQAIRGYPPAPRPRLREPQTQAQTGRRQLLGSDIAQGRAAGMRQYPSPVQPDRCGVPAAGQRRPTAQGTHTTNGHPACSGHRQRPRCLPTPQPRRVATPAGRQG